jgi:hypothetical protein
VDTYDRSHRKTSQIEDFLDALEQEEVAEDDVTVVEIEESEAAYREYLIALNLCNLW